MFRKFLKYIAPKSFKDGLARCNRLGMNLTVKKSQAVFLDAGCGDGALTMEFAGLFNPGEIHGIEFIDSFREAAEKKGIQCVKLDLNGMWPYKTDTFDFILSSQIIEHLHNTRMYFQECYRCLKPGGQILVLTENLSSWANIFALTFGWEPFSSTSINGLNLGNPLIYHADEPKDQDFIKAHYPTGISGLIGHVRVLAFKGLADLLVNAGFKQVKVYTKGYIPLYGWLSDFFCSIDRKHGHFLIASGLK
jgi:SAM-dependent methyltransferase